MGLQSVEHDIATEQQQQQCAKNIAPHCFRQPTRNQSAHIFRVSSMLWTLCWALQGLSRSIKRWCLSSGGFQSVLLLILALSLILSPNPVCKTLINEHCLYPYHSSLLQHQPIKSLAPVRTTWVCICAFYKGGFETG